MRLGRSLHAQLIVLVLVTLLPMLLFASGAIVWLGRHERGAVEQRAIQITRALMAAVDRELTSSITALQSIAGSTTLREKNLGGFHEEARRLLGTQSQWLTISLATPDRRQVMNLLGPRGQRLPLEPESRSFAAVVRTRRPAVSDLVMGPVARQHTFGVRVPVVQNGELVYVLTAVIAPAAIGEILQHQRTPTDWVGTVLDSGGVQVARTVASEQFVARPAADDLREAIGRASEGWFSGKSSEGSPVYAAYSRSLGSGWTVALGIPASAVDGPLLRSLVGLGAGALAAALLGVLLAVVLGRRVTAPIVALAEAAPAIVQGARVPVSSSAVAEVGALASAIEEATRERTRAETDLRRTDRLLKAVFEGTADGVYVKDLDGRYLMINASGARLLGRSPDEVVGKDDAALFTPESARRVIAQDQEVITTGETRTFETPSLETATGVVRTYLSTKTPYRDADGRVIGVMGITRDISDRKLAEEERARTLEREQAARTEAEAANRAKDEFLAILSHELRTPLNAVYGWARMLKSGRLDPQMTGRAVDVIERNAQAQLQLIEDLLDISRVVSGKMRLDVRPVDPAGVVEAAVDSLRPAADAKGVALVTVLDPQTGPISGDPDRLQQVVWNLVANAVKFTPREGRVQVDLQRVGSHIEISVSDTGQGIRPEVLPHIFDRFSQGDSTSTRAHRGLGLGLALVRHLVELHGGTVSARSEGEGRGSTFVVTLPTVIARPAAVPGGRAHPMARAAMPDPVSRMLDGIHVLVVDDDPDALELVRLILTNAGAEVRTCTSAAEAVATLKEWTPDVLLSDLEMPGEDGYALLAKVRAIERELGRHVPAVALTAYGRLEDRVRTLSAGFSMHVPKPADPAELIAVVSALSRRAA